MSFLTAVLDAAGGYARGKQQQFQNQQQQQQTAETQQELELRRQEDEDVRQAAAQQRQLVAGQITDAETARQHEAANRTFEAKLKLPPGFDKYTPDQQTAYLRVRQNAAYAAGDYEFAQEVQKQIDGLYGLTKAGIAAQSRQQYGLLLSQMWADRNASNQAIATGHDTTNQIDTANRDATTLAAVQLRGRYAETVQAIRNGGTKTATDTGMKYLGTETSKMRAANVTAQRAGKPLPYPGLDRYSTIANQEIADVAQHPEHLQQAIADIEAAPETGGDAQHPAITKDMKEAVITALSQTAAQAKAQQSQAEAAQQQINQIDRSFAPGGSDGTQNPPPWFR